MPKLKAQRNVVGLEESDEQSSEQGGDHAHLQGVRKRPRAPEDAGVSKLSSKRAAGDQSANNSSAAPGTEAAAEAAAADEDAVMEDQQQQQQQQQQVPPGSPLPQQNQQQTQQTQQQRRSTSAGGHQQQRDSTPFAAAAVAATAAAFPDHHPDDAAAAPAAGGTDAAGLSQQQLSLRQSSRQPKPRRADTLSSQASASSSGGGLRLGMMMPKVTKKQGKSGSKRLWTGPDISNWGDGSSELPDVKVVQPLPEGHAAVGWGVWVKYEDEDVPWYRGVITCFCPNGLSDEGTPQYQIVMEDGECRSDSVASIAADAAKGDFLFCYAPREGSVPAPFTRQPSLAEEDAAADAVASAAATEQEAPKRAPASAKAKSTTKGRVQQKPAAADGGAFASAAAPEAAAGAAEQQTGASHLQPPSHQQPKKQPPKQQQQAGGSQQQQQRKKLQLKPPPLSVRAGTPTSPHGQHSAKAAAQQLDVSKLSDRARQLARSLQQLQQADQLVAQGLQKQQAALADIIALKPDHATGKEVKDASNDLIKVLSQVTRPRADRQSNQLIELVVQADKARQFMVAPSQQQQKRGGTPGGSGQQARPTDAAALAAAKQQLAKAHAERAAAEKAAAEARAAAAADAAAAEEARAAVAVAEERAAELEAFSARLKLLVPLEPLDDNPLRSKAVAMLSAVLHPPVAVSHFKVASELEQMLSKAYGLVGAGKDMYLKHLYMIWCVLGGRELVAAAEAAEEAAKAAEDAAAAAAAAPATSEDEGGPADAGMAEQAVAAAAVAQVKQQVADAALAKAQEVLRGAPGVADAAAVRNALLDGTTTVEEVFQLTCSKLGFDKQRDK